MPRSRADLRVALDAAWARFRARDIAGARAALAPALAAESESDFTYSAIGHGHLDMAWLWPLRETRRKAARTYTRALNTIADRDGYIYGTSQPQQLLLDQAAASRALRADQEGRRRRPHRAAGQLLGRDRHQPAGRRVAGAAGDGRPPLPAAGVRPRRRRPAAVLAARHLRLQRQPAADPAQERHGLVHDHQARLEQGHRLPAPHLHLAGHRRLRRARAHGARGRLQQPRRRRRPAHRAARSTPRRRSTRRCWSSGRATAAAGRARSTSR